jgi:exopolyphosphatase/guanosine-5'-triphosphate,3'-diphosphate pyrophosphatase
MASEICPPAGVIDIGSNTARLVVYNWRSPYDLLPIAEVKTVLRLDRELGEERRMSRQASDRMEETLVDYLSVVRGTGARHTIAVATAAVRDAVNGREIADELSRSLGITIRVLTGQEEASLAFAGSVYALPVTDGMLCDVGGGSMEVSQFKDRKLERWWSMPLGGLRLADRFLKSDPPSSGEVERLVEHLLETFESAELPAMGLAGGWLICTGGSVRNMAKIDRRGRSTRINRLHGYEIKAKKVSELTRQLCVSPSGERRHIKGLNPERTDSIAGGALAIRTLVDYLGASGVTVSGRGLREGLLLEYFGAEVPSIPHIRNESITSFAARFTTWNETRAKRRHDICTALARALDIAGGSEMVDLVGYAALLLDSGSSIDFYNRCDHAATLIEEGDLSGFTHREIALMAAISRGRDKSSVNGTMHYPLEEGDAQLVRQAGTVLAIGDEVEMRTPDGQSEEPGIRITGQKLIVSGADLGAWKAGPLANRVREEFGRELVIKAPA